MSLPFGSIDGSDLLVRFNSADYSVATVMAGVREHIDLFEEMNVDFLGVSTQIPEGPQSGFRPVNIVAHFRYMGDTDGDALLRRVYRAIWRGVAMNFPDELEWSEAKGNIAAYIEAQADMVIAQKAGLED